MTKNEKELLIQISNKLNDDVNQILAFIKLRIEEAKLDNINQTREELSPLMGKLIEQFRVISQQLTQMTQ